MQLPSPCIMLHHAALNAPHTTLPGITTISQSIQLHPHPHLHAPQVYDQRLFDAVADACLPLIPRCNSQSLANLAWACATARHYRPDLMAAIAGAAVRSMPSFTATSLANLVWAFASLQHWQPELFAAAAPRAAALMPAMDYLAVEMLLWALATFGVRVRRCAWVLLCVMPWHMQGAEHRRCAVAHAGCVTDSCSGT